MKIRNLDEILDEIGDFGRTKNDILDNISLVSLTMSVPRISTTNGNAIQTDCDSHQ